MSRLLASLPDDAVRPLLFVTEDLHIQRVENGSALPESGGPGVVSLLRRVLYWHVGELDVEMGKHLSEVGGQVLHPPEKVDSCQVDGAALEPDVRLSVS